MIPLKERINQRSQESLTLVCSSNSAFFFSSTILHHKPIVLKSSSLPHSRWQGPLIISHPYKSSLYSNSQEYHKNTRIVLSCLCWRGNSDVTPWKALLSPLYIYYASRLSLILSCVPSREPRRFFVANWSFWAKIKKRMYRREKKNVKGNYKRFLSFNWKSRICFLLKKKICVCLLFSWQ